MKKIAVMAAVLLGSAVSHAEVIDIEFRFAPYVGDTQQKEVEIVPGQARVFINNMLFTEWKMRKHSVPVLLKKREIAGGEGISIKLNDPEARKKKTTIRVEFDPQDPQLDYRAQLRWASVTDPVTRTPNISTNLAHEDVDDKPIRGRAVLEREFVANFATDLPWHHYPPITTLSDEDKRALTALVNGRVDAFKPNFSDVYALLKNTPGAPYLAQIQKGKCLDKFYAAGARFIAPPADQLDFVLSNNPEVMLRAKEGPLYRPADPQVFASLLGKGVFKGMPFNDLMECDMALALLYPPSLSVVRTPAGAWQVVY